MTEKICSEQNIYSEPEMVFNYSQPLGLEDISWSCVSVFHNEQNFCSTNSQLLKLYYILQNSKNMTSDFNAE